MSPAAIQLIEAPGEDDPVIIHDEHKLMTMTRFVYGPARTPHGLRRAEKFASLASHVLAKTGLQKPPALRYLDDTGSEF